MSSPKPPSQDEVRAALAGQRFDVANLRVQIGEAEHTLRELDEFEVIWTEFTKLFGEVVQKCEKELLSLWHPAVEEALKRADGMRLDLSSRQPLVLPDYRDPLATLLRTSLRTFSVPLWRLIGNVIEEDGRLMVPMGGTGQELHEVSLRRFEITIEESRGELARRRRDLQTYLRRTRASLEEVERAVGEAQIPPIATSPLELPDKVTVRWAVQHVPVSWWLILVGAFVATFGAGLRVGMIPEVRRIVGALLHIETP